MDIRVLNMAMREQWNLVAHDYEITKSINTLPSISFKVLKEAGHWTSLAAEGYVVTDDGRFTIKEVNVNDSEVEVFAVFDFETFQYSRVVGQVTAATTYNMWVESLFAYSEKQEWTVELHIPPDVQPSKQYINWKSYDNPTKYEGLQIITERFGGEFVIDNVNKRIDLYEARHCGENRGAFVIDDFNALDGTVETSSEDCFTWLYPYGKNGLTISSVTPAGEDWILNKDYINKNIEATWTDESYTDARSLYNAALRLLNEKCKPQVSYSLSLLDIYRISGDEAFRIELGDTIRLSMNGNESEQVVVKTVFNEDNPALTKIELSSATTSLVDRIINIEKRKVSGSTGGGGGGGSTSWNEITGKPTTFPPSSHTHTISEITDFPNIPTALADLSDDSTHRTVTDTEKSAWDGKQNQLISGTNIKTINNMSILGSGNIDIEGGGGGGNASACCVNGTASTLSSSAGTQTKIALNNIIAKTEDESFTISNGALVCNRAGLVKISACVYEHCSSGTNNRMGTYIRKNWVSTSSLGTELASTYMYVYSTNSGAVPIAPKIIQVAAGDKLTLHGRCSVAGVIEPSNAATYLTAEYIK